MSYPFLKGHGTENDFVLLPDHDGSVHGGLTERAWTTRVAALCDRRAGIGGDGVLRVVRTAALTDTAAQALGAGSEWFMDYRNADGSVSEMCGNGVRVFARHLVEEGLVPTGEPVPIGTRDGLKTVTVTDEGVSVDMGIPRVLGDSVVSVAPASWTALHIDMGNPHAVAFVDSLDPAGPVGALLEAPEHDGSVYPHGVNVEFVLPVARGHVAMRVHERGSGETRSCGTGACAVAVAAALRDGVPASGPDTDATYRVDVPGGSLAVTWTRAGRAVLSGPAVVVARGETCL
ncbi:diaminopimelate epimerase [Nocardioides acrostichi]|uniref:Diaminopimelate epimerase n=1 Tax=Nocardioides acrostichi TaxID=2784339 RepID=A0A930V0V7_9ACTN|nr:diaminopimelate epimerase [Nocardioides acrostichi]MBF4161672.1 diaminopimelate epimerase [Nocardioides acrostichi]